MNDFVVGWLVG